MIKNNSQENKMRFTKMHGLGNDFMVINAIDQTVELQAEQIKALARRDTGVGFDQCLMIEASQTPGIDFNYRIFNADGGEVGQCGNGARCLARFIRHEKLSEKNEWLVATTTTQMRLQLHADHSVSVTMGKPLFAPDLIPVKADSRDDYFFIPLTGNEMHPVRVVNVGNPHALTLVDDIELAPVTSMGRLISEHKAFPLQVNAGFMQILSPDHLALRVYERGVGETRACGSGAVAAAVIGRRYYQMAEEIRVSLPGGDLLISWPGDEAEIIQRGPAEFVYQGELLACV